MKYDVTIGIPVYRSLAYINQTMMSALSQTYESIEFLIVDDGGNDGSMEVVRSLQKNHPRGGDIRIISHSENLGVATSRNYMIEEAEGDYLFFLDSDDVIAEHAISLMMEHAMSEEAEMVIGSYEKIEVSGKRTVYQYPSKIFQEKDGLACFAYRKYAGIQASSCNYLIKTKLLRDYHLRFINTDYWEDLVFTFDLVTFVSRAVLLPDITYTYLCRENSLSRYQNRPQITKDEIMRNVRAIDHLKQTSKTLAKKVYYPRRCYCIAMTDFYMACTVLRRRKEIIPEISNTEIRAFMQHPALLREICTFSDAMMKNMLLYILGAVPASVCVRIVWCLGKMKKLI